MKVDSIFGILLFSALIIALVVFGPWLGVWALNTLFPSLSILFNFDTWLAMLIVSTFFHNSFTTFKK